MTAIVIRSLSLSARLMLAGIEAYNLVTAVSKGVVSLVLNSITIGRGFTAIKGKLLGDDPSNPIIY